MDTADAPPADDAEITALNAEAPPQAPVDAVPGATAGTPLHLGWRGWKAVLKRIYVMSGFHSLPLLAAGVAFYAFLTIAPAIAAIVMIFGLFANPAIVSDMMGTVIAIVPGDVANVIRGQLLAVVNASAGVTGIALAIAIFFVVFGAMRASGAMIQALNIIYQEHDSRSIMTFYWRSAMLTAGAILLAIVGIAAGSMFVWLSTQTEDLLGPQARVASQILTWLLAGLLAVIAFGAVYRYAPDRRAAKWRWLTLGSIVATLLWVGVTFLFGLYASYVANYNATYGSLGAVVALLMWLWLTSYAVLIGALVNAEAERQTARDSTVGPDRPIGERGAVMADTQALDAASRELLEKKRRRHADRAARRSTREALGLPRRLRGREEPAPETDA